MKFRKKISKKELIKTLQNNYEVVLERKNELYNENIELQMCLKNERKALNKALKEIEQLAKENGELKIKNKDLKKQVDEANKDKVELGIKFDELKKEKAVLKGKLTKLKNKTDMKVEITAPSIEKGNKIIEKHFEEKQKGGTLTNGRF